MGNKQLYYETKQKHNQNKQTNKQRSWEILEWDLVYTLVPYVLSDI